MSLLEFNTHPYFWSRELEEEFATIAKAHYPNEVVCIVTNKGLVNISNESPEPTNKFYITVEPELLESAIGIIHSHPNSDTKPSEEDCRLQLSLDLPSGIMSLTEDSCSISMWSGEHLLSKPLKGRPFHHVYYDCYSLIRSYYYQEKNIVINDYPRQDNWWHSNQNLYDEQFEDAGFFVVDTSKGLLAGDIVLMKINSHVVNHAAIYLGNDDILHHLYGKLSRVDKLSTWAKVIEKVVRYAA